MPRPEPGKIAFASARGVSHDPGVTDHEQEVDGVRWALVEYGIGAMRADWCDTPHVGYVIAGSIRYEFEDERDALELSAGEGFVLPASPRHRGANTASEPCRLFLIDADVRGAA